MLCEARGYLLTEAWCESPLTRQYRVKDCWAWHRDFEKFREQHQSEYERFESWIVSGGLIEKEQFLGAYYDKGRGDEDELVPG